jgi:hypothetical protein
MASKLKIDQILTLDETITVNVNQIVTNQIDSLTANTTPVDADLMYLGDSTAAFGLKKLSWANIKATLKTYFDTFYMALTGNQTIAGNKSFTGSLLMTGASSVIGYGTGSGGKVTQLTSKSTTVTLNKPNGLIHMNNATLAAGASVTFTLNNSSLSGMDNMILTNNMGVNYSMKVSDINDSFAYITVKNESAGSLSDVVQINFAIIKGAHS